MSKYDFTAYMDGIDFFCEQGLPTEGNRIFANLDSLEDQKWHSPEGWGVVEVEIRLKRIVKPGEHMPDDV